MIVMLFQGQLMFEATGDLAAKAMFKIDTVQEGSTQVGRVSALSSMSTDNRLLYQVSQANSCLL